MPVSSRSAVELFWLPLGAGGHFVRLNGRLYEALAAWRGHRARRDLYHSALIVTLPTGRYVIEQAWPIPRGGRVDRGVVSEGPVGTRLPWSLRFLRYEARRWRDGVIADINEAVASPVLLTTDVVVAARVLQLVPEAPTPVWGRDELATGEMWNSNSLISWLLARADVDLDGIQPPPGGRAPGWDAGRLVAGRNDRIARRPPAAAARDIAFAGMRASLVPNRKASGGANAERQIWRGLAEVLASSPLFLFAPFYRRRHLRWGADDAELQESMPGDEALPDASFNATRAITIDAPREAVWPWLVQIGYGRAGWYSYDLFDNAGHPSAEHELPEYQHPQVGDWVPMFAKVNEATAFKIKAFEPNEWMLWEKPNSTWAWSLKRLQGGRTRLVTRLRQKYDWKSPGGALLTAILMEFGDFPMMRKELKGIRRRAEANVRAAETS